MKFVENLTHDLTVKTTIKKTEKAILVNVTRYINSSKFDEELNRISGFKLFEDQMWIPKSAIQNGVVAEWFSKKENITTLN